MFSKAEEGQKKTGFLSRGNRLNDLDQISFNQSDYIRRTIDYAPFRKGNV